MQEYKGRASLNNTGNLIFKIRRVSFLSDTRLPLSVYILVRTNRESFNQIISGNRILFHYFYIFNTLGLMVVFESRFSAGRI